VIKDQRIMYLDYLRALACLLVVMGHVYLLGYNGYDGISNWVPGAATNIFGPDAAQKNIITGPLVWLAVHARINVGILGVGIFFLISGYVILLAVERESIGEFIVRRIFRIFPASVVVIVLTAFVTSAYCYASGTASPHTLASVAASVFLVSNDFHLLATVPVLWTLRIEVIFYILMAILATFGALSLRALVVTSIICSAIAIGTHSAAQSISFDALGICFLLVGSIIYRVHASGRLKDGIWIIVGLVLFFGTRNAIHYLAGKAIGGLDSANAAWAFAIFISAMVSGLSWRGFLPLRWVADISYPLYLVHIPLAWIVFAILASRGFGMLSSGLIVGALILFVAWFVHVAVEKPCQNFSRRLFSNEWPRRHKAVLYPAE